MGQKRILIIDDEPSLSALLREALETEGAYLVDMASDGLEGFHKYKEFSPDLVIMDISMPVMDGYDSSRQIKSYDRNARILVLTGNTCDSRARNMLKDGYALALLEKPIKLFEFTRIVSENLPDPLMTV